MPHCLDIFLAQWIFSRLFINPDGIDLLYNIVSIGCHQRSLILQIAEDHLEYVIFIVFFFQGCRALKADNLRSIQQRLPEAAAEALSRPDLFKDLYRFTFRFGLASCCSTCPGAAELRILPLDMAVSLWQLVFSPREPPILSKWVCFLQDNAESVRGISRDTWNMFLNFCETVGADLSVYDEDEAWPSLFDDFVEFENDQANQNYETKNVPKDMDTSNQQSTWTTTNWRLFFFDTIWA